MLPLVRQVIPVELLKVAVELTVPCGCRSELDKATGSTPPGGQYRNMIEETSDIDQEVPLPFLDQTGYRDFTLPVKPLGTA
jgi:hypothetical protein